MGVRFPSVSTTTNLGVLPASAAETAIITTPPLNISLDFAVVFLAWFLAITTGATTTALVFRIRRGSGLTGATIGAAVWTHTIGAAASAVLSGKYSDTPGAVAAQQYTLTVSQTGATGAGTLNDNMFLAFSL